MRKIIKNPVVYQKNIQEVKDEYLYVIEEEKEGKTLDCLTEIERMMLDMVLLEGMKYTEIKEQSNLSYGHVRGGYTRGAQKLINNKLKRKYETSICPYCGEIFKNYYHQNECNSCRKGDIVL